jgi:hypothetical protein
MVQSVLWTDRPGTFINRETAVKVPGPERVAESAACAPAYSWTYLAVCLKKSTKVEVCSVSWFSLWFSLERFSGRSARTLGIQSASVQILLNQFLARFCI